MARALPMAGAADRELVVAARDGHIAAFAVLVDRHHGPLLRYLRRQTGDPELAADLAQETFLDAFRCIDRVSQESSFAAWLYGIARNHLRMAWRRRRLRRFVSLDWLPDPVAAVIPALRTEDTSMPCHERDAIQRVLLELSESQREALLLYCLGGFTAPEVAQILGISRAAAERRISRAKMQFRDRYCAVSQDDPP